MRLTDGTRAIPQRVHVEPGQDGPGSRRGHAVLPGCCPLNVDGDETQWLIQEGEWMRVIRHIGAEDFEDVGYLPAEPVPIDVEGL